MRASEKCHCDLEISPPPPPLGLPISQCIAGSALLMLVEKSLLVSWEEEGWFPGSQSHTHLPHMRAETAFQHPLSVLKLRVPEGGVQGGFDQVKRNTCFREKLLISLRN